MDFVVETLKLHSQLTVVTDCGVDDTGSIPSCLEWDQCKTCIMCGAS
jgi:hypothetical protein